MIKIRHSVFETNSSSTHSLSIANTRTEFSEDELSVLNDLPIIDILPSENNYMPRYFITVEEKLRYLYTAYVQSRGELSEGESDEDSEFFYRMRDILPMVKFVEHRENIYVIEDLEYLFYDLDDVCMIVNKEVLLSLLFDGVIVNYSRDLPLPEYNLLADKEDALKKSSKFYIKFSG